MVGVVSAPLPPRPADLLILAGGIVACSTSVLFIKASTMHPVTLAVGRLLVASCVLSPLFVRDLRRHAASIGARQLSVALLPGVTLGLHLVVWNAGARMTSAANASLVVNMVPLVTPLLLFVFARERLNRGEWLGTGLGVAGILLLTARDYELDRQHFLGDGVCFVAMVLFASYLVMGRRSREVPSLFLYVVPVYVTAGLTCLIATAFVQGPFEGALQPFELAMALGLGLVPTVLGHSALNHAMGRFRGQVVSLANLAQPLSAALLAFLLLGEVPAAAFYVATLLIVGGARLALRAS
jgi:drug/metabolite transporter (DMT)-like permease